MSIQVYTHPEKKQWMELLKRPTFDTSSLEASVGNILKEVKTSGDEAVRRFASMFDKVSITSLLVTHAEIEEADALVSDELKHAMQHAKNNIEIFHRSQVGEKQLVETQPGIQCWRRSVAIEKVGLYIPGGSAPLFSTLLMLGVPATLAGCREIVLCSPPNKQGKIHPAILYAAKLVGITKIFKSGGAQAIAAMAYGTESVPKVYKIFGPGNQYVTCAKQLVQKDGVAIDMPAGPSEVAVLADESANAAFVAADLLSQAEHGADSQSILITTSQQLAADVQQQIALQLKPLSRKSIAASALQHSKIIVLENMHQAIEVVNEYAAEHLIISCNNEDEIGEQIINAGSVFLGNYSPESVGDYASGTNHTLPTNGYAKAYSGVSMDSFVKKITYQKLHKNGLAAIASTVIAMANAEGLDAHANAVQIRID